MVVVVSYIVLFLLLSLLLLLPLMFYGHPKYLRFLVQVQYSEKKRMFIASLLGVFICIFHMVYYNLYPLEKGLLISSLYVFVCFMTKKNMLFLMKVRSNRYFMIFLALLAISFSFVPNYFSCAVVLAYILMFANALPLKSKEIKPMEHLCKIHESQINNLIDEVIQETEITELNIKK